MNNQKFRTLNIIDDYNREGLLIEPSHSLPYETVTQLVDQVAAKRGYPEMIRVDNGPEFVSSIFKEWAARHHILIHYIQPGKPAQNGFIERFNRTYREAVLDMNLFYSLNEVREMTKDLLKVYNEQRPHQSLGEAPKHNNVHDNKQQHAHECKHHHRHVLVVVNEVV